MYDLFPFLGQLNEAVDLRFIFAGLVYGLIASLALLPALKGAGEFVSGHIDRLNLTIMKCAALLALVMAIIQLANVLMRYLYGIGFGWSRELVIYSHAALFLLASPGALCSGGHVRVDILFGRLGDKGQALITALGTLIFLIPLMILILWSYAPTLENSWRIMEKSRETDGLPIFYLFKTLVPVFAWLMLLQAMSEAIKALQTLKHRASSQAEAV